MSDQVQKSECFWSNGPQTNHSYYLRIKLYNKQILVVVQSGAEWCRAVSSGAERCRAVLVSRAVPSGAEGG